MRSNIFFKICIISLLPATFAIAQNNPIIQTIPCPSVRIIQQSSMKLDTTQKVNEKYLVYTSKIAFQESDLSWFITTAVYANSDLEAIKVGKEQLQQTTTKEDVATLIGNDYRCKYDAGIIQAWGKKLF